MHTPGPWINDGTTISARPDPENSLTYVAPICTMDEDWTPELLAANARLIALAPDLLDLCERSLRALSEDDFPSLRDDLREAIRRATGEQA